MPGWIADVIPNTTIRSVWGNGIRDRAVHQFTSVADRNTGTVPVEGMLCWTTAELTLWLFTAGTWRVVREPWQTLALGSMSIGMSGGTGTNQTPQSGTVQYRRFDVDQAEWRCNVLTKGAIPGGSNVVVVFPGVNFDTTAMATVGLAFMNDANSGRSVGTGAVNGGPGQQSGFFINGPEGVPITLSDPGSVPNPWQVWSGFAGSRFCAWLPHVNYV